MEKTFNLSNVNFSKITISFTLYVYKPLKQGGRITIIIKNEDTVIKKDKDLEDCNCNNCYNKKLKISKTFDYSQNSIEIKIEGKNLAKKEINWFGINEIKIEVNGCSSNCANCNGYVNNCTSCLTPFILNNNDCISDCGEGKFIKDNKCEVCNSSCKTCSISENRCTSCSSPLALNNNNVCVSDCGKGKIIKNYKCEIENTTQILYPKNKIEIKTEIFPILEDYLYNLKFSSTKNFSHDFKKKFKNHKPLLFLENMLIFIYYYIKFKLKIF